LTGKSVTCVRYTTHLIREPHMLVTPLTRNNQLFWKWVEFNHDIQDTLTAGLVKNLNYSNCEAQTSEYCLAMYNWYLHLATLDDFFCSRIFDAPQSLYDHFKRGKNLLSMLPMLIWRSLLNKGNSTICSSWAQLNSAENLTWLCEIRHISSELRKII
jgi:hypothetical protein